MIRTAVVSLTCGPLGQVILPILLGQSAIIAGAGRLHVALKPDGPGGKMSIGGVLLALMAGLVMLNRLGAIW